MHTRRIFGLFLLGCSLPIVTFCAQNACSHAQSSPPNFARVFPAPTGQNGYEEFVQAADLAQTCPAVGEYETTDYGPAGPTLASKRKVLADPTVQRLLATLRAGLKKPIRSPREMPELDTLTPDLRDFRPLGRLLRAQIDVLFADGESSRALDCLNDALDFGRCIQVGTLASGVVGLYIENTALDAFTEHLDQISARDCDQLVHLANAHLALPDPQLALVREERTMFLRSMKKYRTHAGVLLARLDPGPNCTPTARRDYDEVCLQVRTHPDSGVQIFDQAADLSCLYFDQILAETRRPPWERTYPEPVERDSFAAKLLYSLETPSYAQLNDRFAAEQARLQILAVHAAVRRYRQQHQQLPDDLETLRLGSLALDPFTGKPFLYARSSDREYTISSAGPYDPGDSKHPPTGQRVPITVPFPPPQP